MHHRLLLGTLPCYVDEARTDRLHRVNCLAAISKCSRLRCLDLGFVSEAIPMSDLLRSIQGLHGLVLLYLPRAYSYAASIQGVSNPCTVWPSGMRAIHINGGFNQANMRYLRSLPPSTSELWLEHCPRPAPELVKLFFTEKGSQLETLHVTIPTKRYVNSGIMFDISQGCGNVRNLCVNIELIGDRWGRRVVPETFYLFPSVERLEIGCLDDYDDVFLEGCLDNMSAYLFSERLPKLRNLLIHRRLRWMDSEARADQVAEMNELLKALACEDGEGSKISEDEAGVVIFGGR